MEKYKKGIKDIYNLTPMQEGMLFHYIMDKDSRAYFVQSVFSVKGEIDIEILEKSFNIIIGRHDILRTSFVYKSAKRPLQVVFNERKAKVYYEDISENKEEKYKKLNEIKTKDMEKGFDLKKDLLMRIIIVKEGEESTIIWSFHHIIIDGWCLGIIAKEIFGVYAQLKNGKGEVYEKEIEKALGETYPYASYIKWLEKQDKEGAKTYWEKYLEGYEQQATLPKTKGREQEGGYILGEHNISIGKDITRKLTEIGHKNHVTMNIIMQAVWGVILQGYNNTEDIVFGSVVSGRPPEVTGIEQMVGLFINTIPVRIKKSRGQNFSEMIRQLQEESLESKKHEYISLAEIQSATQLRQGLIDHIMVFENYPVQKELEKQEDIGFTIQKNETSEQTNYDFNIVISPGEEMNIKLSYNQCVYAEDMIEKTAGHICEVIKQIAEDPAIAVENIEIITEEEKQQILYKFNDTKAEYPKDKTINQLFEEQTEKTPDKTAVVFEYCSLTYRELNEKSNQLARLLRGKGVKANTVVGLMLNSSLEMIIGLLGILKSGGAFLPIEPKHPKDRIEYMLKDAGANILVTSKDLKGKADFSGDMIDITQSDIFMGKSCNLNRKDKSSQLAYVIYTSGTTGNSKGVMIRHYSLVNYCSSIIKKASISQEDETALLSSYAYDLGYTSVFTALLSGATLNIFSEDSYRDPKKLVVHLEKGITYIKITPSLFNIIVNCRNIKRIFENSRLRLIVLGGESINIKDIKQFHLMDKENKINIMNHYGPTESTVGCVAEMIDMDKLDNVIGKPLYNTSIYILDKHNNILPVGIPGEICISGDGLARGYLNRLELTAEKFVANPFEPGERMYRTGDLARWRPDGNIEFIGRIDHQVKIRGFRIELGEIEAQLLKHTDIREVAVMAREDSKGDKYLCAYLVSDEELIINTIREHLSRELPDYMIPSYFVHLDKLPLTFNGKLDRKALPEPDGSIRTGAEYEAPTNETEEKLVSIWQEVLGLKKMGINDNFFELGGHSLKAMVLVSKIHKELDTELELKYIFERPTVKAQAEYINRIEKSIYRSIQPAIEKEYYALSPAQKRMYILNRMEKESTSYNITGVGIIEGRLDPQRFEEAFRKIIERHESLRTTFHVVDGEPMQKIHKEVEFKVKRIKAKEEEAEGIVKGLVCPFDLSEAPLLRVGLVEISEDRHIFLYDTHHIISDGISRGILTDEFLNLYSGYELPKINLQYKDFSEWQNSQIGNENIKKQEVYWLEQFEGEIPVLGMPSDYQRPAVQSHEGDRIHFNIDKELSKKLNEVARATGTTLYMVLLAAYNLLLSKYTGQEDIVVGTPIAGRQHVDLENVIGMFVNTLAIRSFPEGEKTFVGFLEEVKETSLKGFENQTYQFEELVGKLNVNRDMSRNPVFDVMFVLQNIQSSSLMLEEIKLKPYAYDNKISKFDITLQAYETKEGIGFDLEYCTALYMRETMERLSRHFMNILECVTRNLDIKLCDVDIMSEEEKQHILYDFNDTKAEYPRHKTIHQLFEEQAERTPDNIALVFGDKQLTYRELNEKSNQLARLLRKKGIKPDSIIGIMVERSLEMIIGIMGVLKAGGAYLPIDPNYPVDRISYMLEDSGATLLLTDSGELINDTFNNISYIDLSDERIYTGEYSNLEENNNPNNLAYIIYTSGTTGQPKGAMIEHRNVVRLMFNDRMQYDFGEKDVWTMFHSFCFDFSVWEMYGALLYGGKLVVVPSLTAKDPKEYLRLLKKEGVTVLNQTPSAFYRLAQEETIRKGKKLCIRYVIFGGEALKPIMLKAWKEKYPDTKLVNMYGITETTVHVTYKEIGWNEIEKDISNIGKPIPSLTTYVMDRNMKLLPIGVIGELCVGGDGLGRGYLNRPELTSEKFVINLYTGERIYKSGDLARFLPNGEMEYYARLDHQVKIRGFRIELGEIEAVLLRNADIKEAVVTAKDNSGDKYLCAYIISDEELKVSMIREHLSKVLPDYMIPSYFVHLDKLPLTSNGKLDRKALPEPDGSISTGVEYEAPTNETEEKLAGIWQEVLGVERVGINDSFFELGGDSIKAIQVSSKLHAYGMRLEIKEIFTNPRIKELVKQLKVSDKKVDQGMVEGEIPLTPVQKWFFKQKLKYENHFNQAVMIYRKEGFEEGAVKEAFHHIVKHHDALRMVYTRKDDIIIQYNRGVKEKLYDIEVIDLTGEKEYEKHAQAEAQRIQGSINLEQGPLVKLALIKTMDGDHLLIVIHHLVVDGVSWRIIFEDLAAGYEQAVRGEDIQFPDKSDSYREWAYQLKEYAQGEEVQKEIEFWKDVCGTDVKPLKKDGEIKESRNKESRTIAIELNEEETEKLLKGTNRAYNTEINDILLTALGYAIKGYTGEDKVLIELEGHGREEIGKGTDINRTVGWFTTIYPVLLDMDKTQDLSLQIKNIKEGLRKIPKKGIGYGVIKYLMPEERKQGINLEVKPEIGFNYLGQFDNDVERGVFGASRLGTGNSVSAENQRQHAIEINSMVAGGRLSVSFSFDERQFKKETIKAIAESYKESIKEISEHCATKEKSELTPSDLSSEEISIDQIEEVYKKVSSEGEIKDIYYLTPMQEGMLYHYLMDKKSGAYFIQNMLTLKGEVDRELFEKSFNIVIQRHDILRTVVLHEGLNKPLQVVLKERKAEIGYEELREEEKENRINEIKKADRERHFNISKDHLMRVTIVKAGEESTILWSFHHIIMDGWCLGIIAKEIFGVYAKLKNGKGRVNEKETDKEIEKLLGEVCPYGSYIKWLEKQDKEAAKAYWEKYLEGYEQQATLPKTKGREQEGGYILGEHNISIGKDITRKLTEIGHKNHVTMNIIMQAVWGVILQGYNNTEDIVFGSVVSGRPPEVTGIEQMVGLFINTVPVRIKSSRGQKFSEMIRQIQEESLDSKKHEYISLAEIQSATQLKQGLIDHIMVFENYPVQKELEKQEDTGFTVQRYEALEQTNYDFNIVIYPGEEISIKLSYNQCVYAKEMIERTAGHICEVINKLAEDPSIVVEDIEIITQEEKQQILYDFNDTKAEYPKDKTIHQLFEEQVEKTPDNIALVFEGNQLTYRELNEKSNQLARLLRAKGVKPDSIVGIMVERSVEMIIGIMGVLKAGGTYLPIDPDYPSDRILFMLEDSSATVLLTQKKIESDMKFKGEILYLDEDNTYLENRSNLELVNQPENMAYIIYTSGTTGKPKGAMIEHRNVVRLMFNDRMQYDFGEKDVWTMFHSFCFDFSVWEMYGALLYGGKLVVVPGLTAKDPKEYLRLLKKEGVTVLNQTPSAFYRLAQEETIRKGKKLCIRYVIFGGEALKPIMLKAWKEKYPDTKLVNMYGITETTVHVTYKEIGWNEIEKDISNIGKPIPTLTAYVMDRNMKILTVGVAGELCVGGDGVGRGYLNRPELTAEKFVENPYIPREKLYRSGDMVRFLADGDMEYLGRIDHQVKIRGFRIELGEVESQLLKHADIKEAAVIAREDSEKDKYLCAYIVSDEELKVSMIREHLCKDLPDYMIPSYFVQLDKLPLTSNGKLDRKALPEPDGSISTGVVYEAPTNETEEKIVNIWKEVLGAERVGVNDNFFELGGDSIKAIQVSSKLHKYGMRIDLKEIFTNPRIKELSKHVKVSNRKAEQGAVEGETLLTPIQGWFFEQKLKHENHFNQAVMIYRKEGFEEGAVKEAFHHIVKHHDALRMVYTRKDDTIIQYNRGVKEKLYDIEVIDLTGEKEHEKRAQSEAQRIKRSINLEQGPLVKLALIKTMDGDHLLIVIHHLVVDGVSWRIIFEDLAAGYEQAVKGENIQFPDKSDSYQEWAYKLKEYAQGEEIQKEMEYWKDICKTDAKLLKKDGAIEEGRSKSSKKIDIELNEEETEKLLKGTNKAYNTEINDILLTALGYAIKGYTGEDKVLIELEGHGREEILKEIDINRTVGWFTTIYPVLLDMGETQDISRQIKLIKEGLRRIPKKGIGYGVIKYLMPEERKQGINLEVKPEIGFNYLGQFDNDVERGTFGASRLGTGSSVGAENKRQHAIEINSMVTGGRLSVSFSFDERQFKKETIKAIAESYKESIKEISEHCATKEKSELTPSDLSSENIMQKDIEKIYNFFER